MGWCMGSEINLQVYYQAVQCLVCDTYHCFQSKRKRKWSKKKDDKKCNICGYSVWKSYFDGGNIAADTIEQIITRLILRLTELHVTHNVKWAISSGEAKGRRYAGIAYAKGSGSVDLYDKDQWFFSDNLIRVLIFIIKSVVLKISE